VVRDTRGWKWRTFPVFAAFVFGGLIASFIDRPDNAFVLGVRIALVVLAALCVAHIFVTYAVAQRRRNASTEPSGAGTAVDDAHYEDELVYEERPRAKR
jgi:hypothetical protein